MPGYKQSEVGLIPSDWDLCLVSELTNVDPENLSASTDPNFSFNYISLEQVDFGNLIGTSREVFRTAPSRARRVVRHDDVLMSTVRPNLKAHLHFRSQVSDAICSTGFAVLRAKPDAVDPAYIFAHLFASPLNKQIEKTLAGSNYPAINSRDVRELKIPCPPTLREQGIIAQALSDVDALLATLDQVISKKRDLKQAVMQQLLTGKTRLPGFSGPWDVKQIGEFTDCTAGGTPSTLNSAYWDGEIPWMSSGELHLKRVQDVEGRITKLGLNNSSTKIIPSRCVLVGLAGQGKTRGTVAINLIELCTNQSIAAVFPNESFNSEYLFHNLDARYDELRELSTGDGGRGGLNLKIIKSIDIPFPSLEEQDAIASALSYLDAELAALEARRDKTRNIKQAMMQELLTGKTRLIAKEESHV